MYYVDVGGCAGGWGELEPFKKLAQAAVGNSMRCRDISRWRELWGLPIMGVTDYEPWRKRGGEMCLRDTGPLTILREVSIRIRKFLVKFWSEA